MLGIYEDIIIEDNCSGNIVFQLKSYKDVKALLKCGAIDDEYLDIISSSESPLGWSIYETIAHHVNVGIHHNEKYYIDGQLITKVIL